MRLRMWNFMRRFTSACRESTPQVCNRFKSYVYCIFTTSYLLSYVTTRFPCSVTKEIPMQGYHEVPIVS